MSSYAVTAFGRSIRLEVPDGQVVRRLVVTTEFGQIEADLETNQPKEGEDD